VKDTTRDDLLDPRLWEHGDQFTRETWADLAKRIDPEARAFLDQLFGRHPELRKDVILFFFAAQPEDVWMIFDHTPQRFGVQIDPVGQIIVLFDTAFHQEIGSWSPDTTAEAIAILEQRYLDTNSLSPNNHNPG
jgi:hypothetical protein